MIYTTADAKVIEVLSIEHQPSKGCYGWTRLISTDRSKNVWEQNYTDFEACDGMPAQGTKEYTWEQTQLSSGPASLDAKIKKEIEANDGGTMWRDRKPRLLDCIVPKKEL
jgi:hypothetical protein